MYCRINLFFEACLLHDGARKRACAACSSPFRETRQGERACLAGGSGEPAWPLLAPKRLQPVDEVRFTLGRRQQVGVPTE